MSSLLNHSGTSKAAYLGGRSGVRLKVMLNFGLSNSQKQDRKRYMAWFVQIDLLAQCSRDIVWIAEVAVGVIETPESLGWS